MSKITTNSNNFNPSRQSRKQTETKMLNPNIEILNKFEFQNNKIQNASALCIMETMINCLRVLRIRISDFEFVSDFVFWICCLDLEHEIFV